MDQWRQHAAGIWRQKEPTACELGRQLPTRQRTRARWRSRISSSVNCNEDQSKTICGLRCARKTVDCEKMITQCSRRRGDVMTIQDETSLLASTKKRTHPSRSRVQPTRSEPILDDVASERITDSTNASQSASSLNSTLYRSALQP